MCKFEEKVDRMLFSNCKLFKRSFTNKGMGYTFNNVKEHNLIKEDYKSSIFYPNRDEDPFFMRSANPDNSLTVIIDYNSEEIKRYEDSKDRVAKSNGDLSLKPKKVTVSLHNPKEPADMRSSSFTIPLGHYTTVYITPKARKIDESGKDLSEDQRHCKLNNEIRELNIFNTYTRAVCMFECFYFFLFLCKFS